METKYFLPKFFFKLKLILVPMNKYLWVMNLIVGADGDVGGSRSRAKRVPAGGVLLVVRGLGYPTAIDWISGVGISEAATGWAQPTRRGLASLVTRLPPKTAGCEQRQASHELVLCRSLRVSERSGGLAIPAPIVVSPGLIVVPRLWPVIERSEIPASKATFFRRPWGPGSRFAR